MAQRQRLRPGHAPELRDEQDGDDHNDIGPALAIERHQPHRQYDRGIGADDVEYDGDRAVGPAPDQPGQSAKARPGQPRQPHHRHRDQHGGPCAHRRPGQQVTPQIVGAKGVGQAGCGKGRRNVDRIGVNRQQWPQQGKAQHQRRQDQPDPPRRAVPDLGYQRPHHPASRKVRAMRGSSRAFITSTSRLALT